MNGKRGFLGPLLVPAARHIYRLIADQHYRYLQLLHSRLGNQGSGVGGSFRFQGRTIEYVDAPSLLSMWEEIFVTRIYDIGNLPQSPYIIDCGSNIGLAQIYWKIRYGDFDGVAFEADPQIAETCGKNLQQWHCKTHLVAAAVGGREMVASFKARGGDIGSIVTAKPDDASTTTAVPMVPLSPFINRQIDLLKVDIEGSEWEVLSEIENSLSLVNRIFLEFHCSGDNWQDVGKILSLLYRNGFRCFIHSISEGWKMPAFVELTKVKQFLGHVIAFRIPS
jgi:FkbM family methyltransferase